jgi:hypothetical protein
VFPPRRLSIGPNPTEASNPLPIWRGTEISNPFPSTESSLQTDFLSLICGNPGSIASASRLARIVGVGVETADCALNGCCCV